ncbi:MAG: ATP-dependent helicase RecG [Patescibacteria group bacterium]|jgi:ATP-dependent DNA helicase RecG|nr:ATP-dependent helicase RecG [Patescibacteria group bacterium]
MNKSITLDTPINLLSGVGPVVEKGLNKLGISTAKDLLMYFPRKWEDFSKLSKLNTIRPGRVAVSCKVLSIAVRRSHRNKRLTITEAILSDDTGSIKAIWFNQPYIVNTLKKDQSYLFLGNFEFKNNYLSLNNPIIETIDTDNQRGKIFTTYSENSIVSSKILQKLLSQVSHLYTELSDSLPTEVEKANQLIDYSSAIKQLHFPDSMVQVEEAKKRIGYAELFELILTGKVLKSEIQTENSAKIKFELDVVERILKQLNFDLTDAQRKVAWQIFQDLDEPHPMNRMLEGDVGSGKTLVALLAAAMSLNSGYQVALMVPTEILARQHIVTFKKLFASQSIRCELLVSALKGSEKTKIHQDISDGKIDVVIGTHALLSEHVEFSNLGLIIIDEQHRFGVNQRRALKSKANFMPHVLTMTATPIPRSLALVVYGDLDISVIDQLPPNRKLVTTKIAGDQSRQNVYREVDKLIEKSQQVFMVCPSIEQDDSSGMKSVKSVYNNLKNTVFSSRRIATLHGKMKPLEKEQIMNDFRDHKYDILISTTVIEVGVDIANATVLIVENAERFGLAALHQLRGRVGRSNVQSYCYLFTDSSNPYSLNRLQAMEKTNDGFRLAQIDLETRGPGEIYGTTQHGILDLTYANIFDTRLLASVRKTVESFIKEDKMLQYPELVKRINELKKLTSLD